MSATVPLKYLVDPGRPITYGIVQAGPDTPGGVPYIRPADMSAHSGVRDFEDLKRTTPEIANAYRRSTILQGDVIVSIGPSYGKVLIVPEVLAGANLTQGTARIAPSAKSEARFLYWALQSELARQYWGASVGGATFRALNLEPLGQTPIPFHSREEQRRIADFLDTETARIDMMTRLRDQQIALYEERFSAHLRNMVTGTDGHSRQNEHISWLGPIREDWGTTTVGRISRFIMGTTFPHAYQGEESGDYPFIKVSDFASADHHLRIAGAKNWISKKVAAQLGARIVPAGSVLYARVGAALLLNRRVVTTQPSVVDDNVRAVHFREGSPLYWANLLSFLDMGQLANPGPVPSVSESQVASVRATFPGTETQDDIVKAIQRERNLFQRSLEAFQRQVELLQERRRALITAAVTGEFDVSTASGRGVME